MTNLESVIKEIHVAINSEQYNEKATFEYLNAYIDKMIDRKDLNENLKYVVKCLWKQ